MSGFFEIGVYHPKTETNIGTLWRSAYQLGASGIFTVGRRYKPQASDTYKTIRNIPLRHYASMEDFSQPHAAQLIAIEMGGIPLSEFKHPRMGIYLLGAEDHGIPPCVLEKCQHVISLESVRQASYNVAIAGSIVMYDRLFR